MKKMETTAKPTVGLDSSDALMAHGSTALHGCVADKLEAAIDNMMLHTEVRFEGLSITANVSASRRSDTKTQTHALQQRQGGRHHSKQGQVHGPEDKTYGVYKPGPSRCC